MYFYIRCWQFLQGRISVLFLLIEILCCYSTLPEKVSTIKEIHSQKCCTLFTFSSNKKMKIWILLILQHVELSFSTNLWQKLASTFLRSKWEAIGQSLCSYVVHSMYHSVWWLAFSFLFHFFYTMSFMLSDLWLNAHNFVARWM